MSKKVNELNISINKAIIDKISLELTDSGLKIWVSGGLYTKENRKVSEFQYGTDAWNDDKKIDCPVLIHKPASAIFEIMTPVLYEKINGEFVSLPSGQEEL